MVCVMKWDSAESWPVTRHQVLATGSVCDFVEDDISTPNGEQITRQYITHPGAVGVMALDEQNRIAVVDQYRHPVAMKLIEPPAGLLDVAGEDYLVTAQRELAEEALLAAATWRVLVDVVTTPGGCEESIRMFLACDLSPAPRPEGFVVEGEEAHMDIHWVDLEAVVEAIYAGQIQSPSMITGALALHGALRDGRMDSLRAPDAPWPAREVWAERRSERQSHA